MQSTTGIFQCSMLRLVTLNPNIELLRNNLLSSSPRQSAVEGKWLRQQGAHDTLDIVYIDRMRSVLRKSTIFNQESRLLSVKTSVLPFYRRKIRNSQYLS